MIKAKLIKSVEAIKLSLLQDEKSKSSQKHSIESLIIENEYLRKIMHAKFDAH